MHMAMQTTLVWLLKINFYRFWSCDQYNMLMVMFHSTYRETLKILNCQSETSLVNHFFFVFKFVSHAFSDLDQLRRSPRVTILIYCGIFRRGHLNDLARRRIYDRKERRSSLYRIARVIIGRWISEIFENESAYRTLFALRRKLKRQRNRQDNRNLMWRKNNSETNWEIWNHLVF